jgi:hypothetical protein
MKKVEFAYIEKTLLRVDPDYQRPPVDSGKRNRMKVTWSWELCGALLVGKRPDGSYWIVDGQQRWLVAMELDHIHTLPCMVFASGGSEEEACVFKDRGVFVTQLSPHVKFKAALQGKDQAALDLFECAQSMGYRFASSAAVDSIDCVGTVYGRYTHRGRLHPHVLVGLKYAMRIANMQYHITSDLFIATETIARRGSILSDKDIAKARTYSGETVAKKIRDMKLVLGTEGGKAQALALLKLINHNRPKRNWTVLAGENEEVE